MRQFDEQIYDKASRGKHEAAIRDVTERLIMLEEEELDSPAAVRARGGDAAQAAPTRTIKNGEGAGRAGARRVGSASRPSRPSSASPRGGWRSWCSSGWHFSP